LGIFNNHLLLWKEKNYVYAEFVWNLGCFVGSLRWNTIFRRGTYRRKNEC
jgi:hypothetical protein